MRPSRSHGEKRCEIQGGGQEMAVMVAKFLIATIQVLPSNGINKPSIVRDVVTVLLYKGVLYEAS